ncbi:MAG: phenylalanine--tRNA ligase subunit alpha [Planctomycetaceae bacterium]|jgi:phenylalanyl-tRNA synthetase alpha chain|nr:phenylalanine--tRNA ligase subunit alpha [Planctomycetaceae bacterium]MBT6488027.1 phenylalanine--tRNA ligase subunit alpha [Planctomycetaceae bacterium]MBT6497834.1 phenylalanine--tRNA ligase subunit alpha [Planctomycetaceae bacterium]
MDPIAAFDQFEQTALTAIAAADDSAALEAVRVEYLGKSKGRLRDLQSLVGKAEKQQKPLLGKRFNEIKNDVTAALDARKENLTAPKAEAAGLDVTLPGSPVEFGRRHPLIQTIAEFKDIIGRFGFSVAEGPEIEDEHHNFVALNIPPEHPARDPLENFYLAVAEKSNPAANGGPAPRLLRSQTSNVQIRVMEQTEPPVRIVSLGRVYRPDTMDATHSCMFHQMEGLMVAKDVTMAQLKTVLTMFASAYLGHDVPLRFRPSFFPFTEPSVEVDVLWDESGWVELGGAGMVDPNVLAAVGYDPEEVSGFAFGLGIERFCMKRHQINDIRRFYENDVRFLRQF